MKKLWLSSVYDVPQDVVDEPHSPAFRQFLVYRFGSVRVSFDEQLTAANHLSPEEVALGQQLIRRALKSRHDHIISGTWALGDLEAIPLLRTMFDDEPDESRRLRGEAQRLFRRHRPAFDVLSQGWPLNQFEHKKTDSLELFEAVDRRDTGMV